MQQITLDGYDGDNLACRKINVWYDHDDRTKKHPKKKKAIVATVKHRSTGTLLERNGDACKVRVLAGQRKFIEGWVTFFFIKELKADWMVERRMIQHQLKAQEEMKREHLHA